MEIKTVQSMLYNIGM